MAEALFGDDTTAQADAADRKRGKNAKSTDGVEHAELQSIIERIENLTEQKQAIADDIKDIKTEAKATGFDVATINEMLKLRKMDKAERDAREVLRDTYLIALGMEVGG